MSDVTSSGAILSDSRHVYQELLFQPNPDYEDVFLYVPARTTIDQIVIDAVSLPEPGMASLLALSGLILLRRR